MGGTVLNTTLKKDLALTISADSIIAVCYCSSEGKPNSWIN